MASTRSKTKLQNMIEIQESAEWLSKRGVGQVDVGVVLGTGLHGLASKITVIKEFSYSMIPNFPIATVEYHFGKLIYGEMVETFLYCFYILILFPFHCVYVWIRPRQNNLHDCSKYVIYNLTNLIHCKR